MNDIERILDIIEEECLLCGGLMRCLTCKIYTLKSFIVDIKDVNATENDKLEIILKYLQNNYCNNCSTGNCNSEIETFYNCLVSAIKDKITEIKRGEG